ncbi:TonB-dependent receptor [Pseudogemmatithrix spongiicola]|uniref:TonB-dependent receptor n=1 Tax=Pseudogemmatithrix spongiicola TaxID=3062599 RepID=A0AA49K046_9BACT|nr:TonB-dependent receptor [Gemmatimonadaceae bacterium 'strain 138']WKW14972.1 TonB-dependent receptor [Gemmatimonadaceae bacterium 'strain 318']
MKHAFLLLAALPGLLTAQDSLPATVITATRLPTPINAQTAAVTVLDAQLLRAEGVTHVGDALRRVPGIAMARSSGIGSQHTVFMRGGQGNYVRVLVDGVAINEPGGTLDLGRLTLDDVERIEVVRGPASVLYGSEAVTGVIQIITRRGAGAARLRSEFGGGSFGTVRGSLGASGALGRLGWTLQGDRHAMDGVLDFNNAYRNDGISGALDLAADAKTDIRLTGRFNNSMYQYPTGSAGTLVDRNAERTENRVLAGLDVGRRWTDRVETRAQYTWMDLLPRTNDGPDTPGDTLGFYGFFARGAVKRRMADARTTLRVGDAQFLTLGAEWARDQERSTSVSQSQFGDFPDTLRAARENRALYAQALGERGRLSYTVGARLDENSAFGSFRTARLGAGWRIADGLRVRSSAGTAFKAPNFFENFAGGFTVGNPDLRPEESRSADLGIDATLATGVRLSITGFAQRFKNMIQYNGAVPFGSPNYENIVAANAGGVEAEVTLPSVGGVETQIGHTWTSTRVAQSGFDTTASATFVRGGKLLRRPANVTTLQLRRALGTQGNVSAVIVRTGEREDRDFASFPAGVVVLGGFTTVDLAADLRLPGRLGETGRLVLRADNVTDVQFTQIQGFRSPGRILYAGLRLER